MSKGTLYTSKKQANNSPAARKAWRYFEKLNPLFPLVSIQFDFTCQEWEGIHNHGCGIWAHNYAGKDTIHDCYTKVT